MLLGILYAITFVISVGAIVQRNHVTIGLIILNWLLILDTAFTVLFASVLWFRTLQEQVNFEKVWIAAPALSRLTLQDEWKCCGYRNSTNIEIGGSACSAPDVANATIGCMNQFTGLADNLLNETFTYVYTLGCDVYCSRFARTIWGFTAITLCLFVATLCVMKKVRSPRHLNNVMTDGFSSAKRPNGSGKLTQSVADVVSSKPLAPSSIISLQRHAAC